MKSQITTVLWSLFLLAALPVSSQDFSISMSAKSRGIPAYPFPVTVQQPTGGTVELKGMGDGFLHWYETVDGYTVMKDAKERYVYAIQNAEGHLVPSEYLAGERKGVPAGIPPHLRYSAQQVVSLSKSYFPDSDSKSNPSPFPTTGNNNALVILAEFPDRPASLSETDIYNLMNLPGHAGTGSFRDYYLEASYGNLSLQSNTEPWVMMSENMSYYGGNNNEGYDLRPEVLVREAVDSLEARGFDFSPYDNDGDGYVDEIIVFYAGYGEHYIGAGDTCIWSHSYHLGELSVEYDGVRLDNYIITSELAGNSGTNIAPVGIVVHEFSHSLGMPDLYDDDADGSGGYAFDLNFWDLTAVGAWNDEGHSPASVNAWLKRYLGWMTIPVIETTGTYSLDAASEQPDAYQLNTPVYNEYFIVENRQRSGFDRGLPGEGMLIYHVDMNYPGWLTGAINVDPAHQGFDLVEADDIRDTITIPGDPFPGTAGVTTFNSLTTPSSNTWNGESSQVSIQNIASSGGVITFDILSNSYEELPPDWVVDALSYTEQGNITAIVRIGSDTVEAGHLGAFVGEECRGITTPTYDPATDHTLFELTVFSEGTGGETLSFKYYNDVEDMVYSIAETVIFQANMQEGDLANPLIFQASVIDLVEPVVTSCPGNIAVTNDPGECGAVVTYTAPVFEDDVDGTGLSGTLTAGLSSGSLFPVGITSVTYAYTDAAGNGPVECTFTVTVTDDEAATVVGCPSNIAVFNDRGEDGAVVDYTAPLFADNCGGAGLTGTLTAGLASGVQFPMGETTVTYTYTDAAGNDPAVCTFTVTVNKGNYAPEVIVPIEDISRTEGFGTTTIDLTPVFRDPDGDAMTYSVVSGSTDVVTVAVDGTVLTFTEVAPGISEIVVTASDGSLEVEDHFTFTLDNENEAPQLDNPVADQEVDETFGTLELDLTGTFSDPDDDALTITAVSSNTDVVTVAIVGMMLTISEIDTGVSVITLTASDGSLETEDQFEVTVSKQTGIDDASLPAVSLYPNPTGDWLFIDFGGRFTDVLQLEIIDYQGQLLYIEQLEIDVKGIPLEIDMQEYNGGLYFIRITGDGASFIGKIVKQ